MTPIHPTLRLFLPFLAAAFLLCGCQKKPYSQATPQDVIKSAQKMIEKGESKKLEQLIYADSPEMRKVITRMGRMFGSLGDLAIAINARYPKDVEELKKNASSGGLTQLMGEFTQQQRRRPQFGEQQDSSDMFGDALKQLLVDPYSWLKDNSGRLTTAPIDDNTVALLWDGKPMLAPLGLIMRRDAGKWYLVLPTNAPFISQYMPRSPNEFYVFEKLIVVFDNALKDLTKDINANKLPDLNEVSRAAGQKALAPVALVMIAYGNMMEERHKEANAKAESAKADAARAEAAKAAQKSDSSPAEPSAAPK